MERYLMGESIAEIAKSLGIGTPAMYRHIWRHLPDEWPAIRAARAEHQYDGAIDKLADWEDEDLDGVTVNRAHVIARLRFQELAALRREFSNKQEVTQVNINVLADPQILSKLSTLIERARALDVKPSLVNDDSER